MSPFPLSDALGRLAEETGPPDNHPTVDELIGYREGKLDEDAAEELREHLVRCSECADRYLDLVAFLDDVPSSGEMPEADGASLNPAPLPAAPAEPEPPAPSPRPAAHTQAPRPRRPWAFRMAAGLVAAASLFVGFRILEYRATANALPVNLTYTESGTRGPETQRVTASRPLQLRLREVPPSVRSLRAQVFRFGDGDLIWEGDPVIRTGSTVELGILPRGKLEPGVTYQVAIQAPEDREPRLSFHFEAE